MIMKQLFGTDGIRGVAGQFPLDAPTIYAIARSLVRELSGDQGKQPRLVTGRDTRISGPEIEAAFHAGAVAVCRDG